jgi:hypothetical protein
MRRRAVPSIVTLFTVLAFAADASSHEGDSQSTPAESDSASEKNSGYMFLPVIFYTPETKMAGGVSAMRYFRPEGVSKDARPSKIWATFILTQRSQYIADLFNEFYFKDEKYLIVSGINYVKFPDRFCGIGPDTPDSLVEDYTFRRQHQVVYWIRD